MTTLNVDLLTDGPGTGSPTAKGLILTNSTSAPANGISLAATDDAMQFLTPTANLSVELDNSHKAGRVVTIVNLSATKVLSLVAADLSVIRTVYPLTAARIVPLQNTPTSATHWMCLDVADSGWLPVTGSMSLLDTGNDSAITNTSIANLNFKRNADTVRFKGELTFTGVPAPSNNSGASNIWALVMPPNFTPGSIVLATNVPIEGSGDFKAGGVERGPCGLTVWTGGVTILGALALQFRSATSVGPFGSTAPVAWQSGDRITFDISYQVATWTPTKG